MAVCNCFTSYEQDAVVVELRRVMYLVWMNGGKATFRFGVKRVDMTAASCLCDI